MSGFSLFSYKVPSGPILKSTLYSASLAGSFLPRPTWGHPTLSEIEAAINELQDRTGVVSQLRLAISSSRGRGPFLDDRPIGLEHVDSGLKFWLTYHQPSGEFGGKLVGPQLKEFVSALQDIHDLAYSRSTIPTSNARVAMNVSMMETLPCAPFAGRSNKPETLIRTSDLPRFEAFGRALAGGHGSRSISLFDAMVAFERSSQSSSNPRHFPNWMLISKGSHAALKRVIEEAAGVTVG